MLGASWVRLPPLFTQGSVPELMRRTLIVGNWKMHGSQASVEALVSGLVEVVATASAEVAVCPVALHIPQVIALAAGSKLGVGGQNCSDHAQGAYTGEVAAAMLADAGCRWVILGHSERRQYFGESDALIAAKSVVARVPVCLRYCVLGRPWSNANRARPSRW